MTSFKFAPQDGRSARTLAARANSVARASTPERGSRHLQSNLATAASPAASERATIAQPIPRGDRLIIGDDPDQVTVVQSGSIALFKALPGNRWICVGILGPGDLVLTNHDTDDQIVAEALTDAVVLREDFQRLVSVLSGSQPLVQAALSSMRRQAVEMRGLIARLLSRDITLRLAFMLVSLGDRFGKPNQDGMVAIGIPVAHKMLARMIGSNRVTVTRVMTEMRDQGMVQAPGRNQIVIDPQKLRSFVASAHPDRWTPAA